MTTTLFLIDNDTRTYDTTRELLRLRRSHRSAERIRRGRELCGQTADTEDKVIALFDGGANIA